MLGLGPRSDGNGPLLVEYFYNQGTIERPRFAVMIRNENQQPSSIRFGGYDALGTSMYKPF